MCSKINKMALDYKGRNISLWFLSNTTVNAKIQDHAQLSEYYKITIEKSLGLLCSNIKSLL
jgi:hypothetical protein